MLTTLLFPTKGTASITGYDIVKNRNQVRQNIGIVFQEPALDTELTGQENLDFHARMYGLTRDKRKNRIAEVLTLVDLDDKKDTLVKQYSGGMKRRLEIARGLMHFPKVLFLDEPTLGLDAQTRRAIWNYIKKMNYEEKTTIFLTTHYMDEADFLCDRIGIIDHGELLIIDTTSNLKGSVGNDVITLSCSNIPELQKHLSGESWISNIKQHESQLTVGVKKGEEKIPRIIEFARNLGIQITSINIRKPTLDDVFLSFTGATIRDREVTNPFVENMKAFHRRHR
jgi:ABC-2 type transport system ATP-binding protein